MPRVMPGWLTPTTWTSCPMVSAWPSSAASSGMWAGCTGKPASDATLAAPACIRSPRRFRRLPRKVGPSSFNKSDIGNLHNAIYNSVYSCQPDRQRFSPFDAACLKRHLLARNAT